MLIAVLHHRQPDNAEAANAAGAPHGAAVSWVAGRFYIHGHGEVSPHELIVLDAAGDLSWIDLRAREWLRSRAADAGRPASAGGGRVSSQATVGSAPDQRPSPAPDPFVGSWPGEEQPLWRRVSAEQYRIATYVVVGLIAVLLIVLASQGSR